MTTHNPAHNIQCRTEAEAVIAMALDADLFPQPRPQRFWECLAELVAGQLPPKPALPAEVPMTYEEALAFEAEVMPYGVYSGRLVREIPAAYFETLIEGTQFSRNLRRYARSRKFTEERGSR